MPFIAARDGTNLYVKEWGSGEPVLFVHGGQLGADMWEYQMVPLAEHGLRCLAYDRRGCGRSDQPGYGYDFDTMGNDLAAVIEQLDLRRMTLVGHSMGCGDIARYLSRHGAERVKRTVLVAPTTPFLLKTDDNPDGIDKSVFDGAIAALHEDRPRLLAMLAEPFFGIGLPDVSVTPEMIRWGVCLALRSSPLATIEMTRTHAETDFRPDMAAFTIPTLVIHGIADQTAPFALCGQRTAEAIPGSQLVVYKTGHGLFVTERERLTSDLLAWVMGDGTRVIG